MEWNYISDNKYPKQYEEVIVCSRLGKVKTAIYLGNNKWSTFYDIVCWMGFPESPIEVNKEDMQVVPAVVKKRGRPKKA